MLQYLLREEFSPIHPSPLPALRDKPLCFHLDARDGRTHVSDKYTRVHTFTRAIILMPPNDKPRRRDATRRAARGGERREGEERGADSFFTIKGLAGRIKWLRGGVETERANPLLLGPKTSITLRKV